MLQVADVGGVVAVLPDVQCGAKIDPAAGLIVSTRLVPLQVARSDAGVGIVGVEVFHVEAHAQPVGRPGGKPEDRRITVDGDK